MTSIPDRKACEVKETKYLYFLTRCKACALSLTESHLEDLANMILLDHNLSLLRIAIAAGGLLLLYHVLNSIIVFLAARKYARCQGCGSLPVYPTRMFGFSALFEVLAASKAHRLLEANQQRFAKMNAKTFSMTNMGKTSIYTIEPENVKAMLATQFQSWSLPELRKTAFHPLFGHGIFTNDGAA